jgi:ribosomal protein S18 acetylase RimI-like enzyme
MLIRKLVKSDAEAFRELRLRALQTNPEAYGSAYEDSREQDLETFRQRIPEAASDDALFAAEEEGQLRGMLVFVRSTGRKQQHKATIYGVYVEPYARGRGIGRLLMQQALDHARQLQGVRQLLLSVVTTQTAAVKLYESVGFTIWGTEPAALLINGAFYDEYYMILYL